MSGFLVLWIFTSLSLVQGPVLVHLKKKTWEIGQMDKNSLHPLILEFEQEFI
jgi:hypothetical protein